jgi:hypothetical protein
VPTLPNLPPKTSTRLYDIMIIMGDVLCLLGSMFQWRDSNPPGSNDVGVPLVESPPLLWYKSSGPSLSYLYPMMGSQHPPSGLFNPMEVQTDHLPMCTYLKLYLSIRHDPAHQQLRPPWVISHMDHSNVNHISSLIFLNMCLKSLIPQLKSQRHYTSLQYKFGEMTGCPIGLVSIGRGKFPEKTSSDPCKWVMWARDVQESGCSERRG